MGRPNNKRFVFQAYEWELLVKIHAKLTRQKASLLYSFPSHQSHSHFSSPPLQKRRQQTLEMKDDWPRSNKPTNRPSNNSPRLLGISSFLFLLNEEINVRKRIVFNYMKLFRFANVESVGRIASFWCDVVKNKWWVFRQPSFRWGIYLAVGRVKIVGICQLPFKCFASTTIRCSAYITLFDWRHPCLFLSRKS